jgi:hypothetical protein
MCRNTPDAILPAATSPSGLRRPRRLVASGLGLLAPRCLVGIEGPLELAPFGLRPDLDEDHHDDTGPQCPAERIQQVGQQAKRLRRWRRSEQVAADLGGQAHHEADPEDPVHGPLPGSMLPILGQVLLHPGRGARIVDVDAERSGLVGERLWSALCSRSSGHGRTSCQPVRSRLHCALVVLQFPRAWPWSRVAR